MKLIVDLLIMKYLYAVKAKLYLAGLNSKFLLCIKLYNIIFILR